MTKQVELLLEPIKKLIRSGRLRVSFDDFLRFHQISNSLNKKDCSLDAVRYCFKGMKNDQQT